MILIVDNNNNHIVGICLFTYRNLKSHLKINGRRSNAPTDLGNQIEFNKILHIQIFCVKYRRQGYGKNIMNYIKKYAKNTDCDFIE
jgi:hypothetical protein